MYEAKTEFPFVDLDFYPDAPPPQLNSNICQPGILPNVEWNAETETNSEDQHLLDKQSSQPQHRARKAAFNFCPPEHRGYILNLMVKHLHQHPLIPAPDKQYYSQSQIREAAVKEMYYYCKKNDLRWVWSYLWAEWYSLSKWPLWVRSAKSGISVLKTTMIVESHWRLVKRDYLYKFNRPHVDLLVWILVDRLIPRCVSKIQQLRASRLLASWRLAFKRAWKECSNKTWSGISYAINPTKWTCSCPDYLQSRFLICKHLVQSVCPVDPNFFNEVRRSRVPPFWIHNDLIPLVQGLEPMNEGDVSSTEPRSDDESDDDEYVETIREHEEQAGGATNEIVGEESRENWEEVNRRVSEKLQKWVELLRRQEEYKDVRFLLEAEGAMREIENMVGKCEKIERRRTLPRMWKDTDKQTMFYRGVHA